MRNPEWVSLTDAERGQLVSIWLLAADHGGVIPASPDLIQKLCFMEKKPNLNKFIELSFICQNGVNVASGWRQDDVPEENREEKNREEKPRAKKFTPPILEEVVQYFTDNGYSSESAEKAFKYYEEGNPPWTDSQGNKVRSWKQKMRAVWFKDENKIKQSAVNTGYDPKKHQAVFND